MNNYNEEEKKVKTFIQAVDKPELRCTAKSKRSGEQCKAYRMKGSTKCKYHGGKSKKGMEASNIKTGRYSKYLPKKLLSLYQETLQSETLLDLKGELELIETRISDILSGLDAQESQIIWKNLQEAMKEYKSAKKKGDIVGATAALEQIDTLIFRGKNEYDKWNGLLQAIESKRRILDSQYKAQMALGTMISAEQVMLLVNTILSVINKNVTDESAKLTIINDIEHLLQKK